MITITLPPELEQVVTERAHQQGTTPELLAFDILREHLLPAAPAPSSGDGQTMADFLGDFIGCYDSRELVTGGANLAADTGRKFTELMLKKRREGKL
jgi:hypothetical protein